MRTEKEYAQYLYDRTKSTLGLYKKEHIILISCMGLESMIEIAKENNLSSRVSYLNKVKEELKELA